MVQTKGQCSEGFSRRLKGQSSNKLSRRLKRQCSNGLSSKHGGSEEKLCRVDRLINF